MAGYSYMQGGGGVAPGGVVRRTPQEVQGQQYADQTYADSRQKQADLNQDEVTRNRLLNQSYAKDRMVQMMADPNSRVSTNGIDINVDNYGGGAGSSRASGGIQIGGGTYPDVSGLMATINKDVPREAAPDRVGAPSVPSTSGAFAHAKDVAGRQGNKAIDAFHNMMTSRGMSDSGMTAQGDASILGGVGRQQADAEYQAANTDNTRQWEANQMGYQGDLAQNQMAYQGGITQRGQDMSTLLNLLRQLY